MLLLLFITTHCFSQTTDTSYYSVVNLGKVTGENKAWKTSPTEKHYSFYYNDRGRGSVINAVVTTNHQGKIEKVISSGQDYYKVPFTSSFQKQNDSLISQFNSNRSAERDSGQNYVYYGVPAAVDILIKHLLKSPGKTLFTTGGDTTYLDEPVKYNLVMNGKKLSILLCSIKFGINSIPDYIWVDTDHNFFGNISGWTATIKKDYEKLVDTLYALQEINALPYFQRINKQLTDSLPNKLAISNVRLFDAPNARSIPNQTVLVENGKIKTVAKASAVKIPNGYTVIDGKGRTLLPGLWDTHGHYQKNHGSLYLRGGVTHVRDMGNMPYIKQLQKSIRQHELIGPDISYLSGFIDKDDEYHGPVGKLVNSKMEAVKAVNDFKKEGYDQIKIYSSIDTGWVKAMVSQAHKNNMLVAGHIPVHMTASEAVKKGYDEITHMNMVMLNFFPDTIDTRKDRLKSIGRIGHAINLKSSSVKTFVALLKEKNTVVEPTINNYADMFDTAPGDTNVFYKPIINWGRKRDFKITTFMDDTLNIPAYKQTYMRMLEMLKLLYDNGIQLLAGTDDVPPFALQLELELFVKAGIPANQVLKIATYDPAKIFKLDNRYGSIKETRIADFILVDGDPLKNISDIRKVFMVVTNHQLFYPKKLYNDADWDYYY